MSLVIPSKEVTASLTLLLYIAVLATPQGPKLSEEDTVPVVQLPRQSRFGRNIGTLSFVAMNCWPFLEACKPLIPVSPRGAIGK